MLQGGVSVTDVSFDYANVENTTFSFRCVPGALEAQGRGRVGHS